MVSISATLIVRNEERFLADCLASIRDAVDEIVVVDTGSVDRTPEIAREAGARLLDFPWIGDFAAARNAAIEAARGDWLLYIDADERLRAPPSGLAPDDMLSDSHVIAATVRFRPFLRATPYREHRLFRRDPRIRFTGAIHETIVPSLNALAAGDGSRIPQTDSEIIHLGYEGDRTHKYWRNLPLLRMMVEREPNRLFYWYDLARTLARLDLADEAMDVARRGLAIAQAREDSESRMLGSLIAWVLAGLLHDRNEDPLPVIDEALGRYPGQGSLMFLKARVFIDIGRYEEALGIIDDLLAHDLTSVCDPTLAYDERIFGAFSLELRAVALLRLGRRSEAATAFQQASVLEPGEMSYRAKAVALSGRAAGPLPGADMQVTTAA